MLNTPQENDVPRTAMDLESTGQITFSTSQDSRDAEIAKDIANTGIALAANETVSRYGSAGAEFIKGYRGIDNETGQRFAKGQADIAKHKVNPDPAQAVKNIKQQAGYAAEVAATSRDNAEYIIQGSEVRTSRSDDLPQYGRNHTVVDRVQVLNGEIIEGSQAQMKFVGDRDALFRKIAEENKNGKNDLSRYRGVKLDLSSEQFEGAKQYCRDKANARRQQADAVRQKGKPDLADRFLREADNYDQLADNVADSGLTTKEAIFYRVYPKVATVLDIARTSHRAGKEGAKYGAIIACCISLVQNGFSVAQGKKEMGEAAKDLALDTAKAAALGYGTAFAGSAIKGGMQQSGRQTIRTLANTSAPTLVVNVCLSLGSSVKRYVTGEISEVELLTEMGEKGAGMLSAGMMTALGQLAIPVPFVGAAIGGMIGYTLSSLFYQSALDAAKGAELSRKMLERTRAIQEAARARIAEEQTGLDAFVRREIPQLHEATQQLFVSLSTVHQSSDAVSTAINQFATLLGKQLEFQSMADFDDFMRSDRPLTL
ncbi:MAG: hypothetical protein KGZ83_15860 [Sulfuricella sp.]|nr:hypothetical protein [Sulfuricella sp.]